MIILDTNVLSALMRREPDREVIAWLDNQAPESIWITSITEFESRYGLALLPDGRRKKTLESAFARLLKDDLEGRVLPFDSAAAEAASLAARRQLGDQRQQVLARDLGFDQYRLAVFIDPVDGKNILGEIDAYRDNAHGLPLSWS